MKNYERITLEIVTTEDVVVTSSWVETGRIPFSVDTENYSYDQMSYDIDPSAFNT